VRAATTRTGLVARERRTHVNTSTWVLLGFAAWTLATLLFGVGAVRWSLILTGRKQLNEFPADAPHGSPRYRRAMRAHANCVENLPVLAAVVIAANAAGVQSSTLDVLAQIYLAARVAQTVTHVALEETPAVVGVRFGFFATQLACVVAMGTIVAHAAR
jgi:uncharacterized MAPEG superfamily protein